MEESTVSIPESGISRGGRIFHSKLNFRFPAMHEAKAFVQDAYGHASWRSKILHFLHDHKVQSILLALLVLVRVNMNGDALYYSGDCRLAHHHYHIIVIIIIVIVS